MKLKAELIILKNYLSWNDVTTNHHLSQIIEIKINANPMKKKNRNDKEKDTTKGYYYSSVLLLEGSSSTLTLVSSLKS